jgi:hypothetical protein
VTGNRWSSGLGPVAHDEIRLRQISLAIEMGDSEAVGKQRAAECRILEGVPIPVNTSMPIDSP